MRILLLTLVGSLLAGCGKPPPPKPSPCRYVAGERSPRRNATRSARHPLEKEAYTGR